MLCYVVTIIRKSVQWKWLLQTFFREKKSKLIHCYSVTESIIFYMKNVYGNKFVEGGVETRKKIIICGCYIKIKLGEEKNIT